MAVESITVGDLVSRVHFHIAGTATAGSTLATEIKWALDFAMKQLVRQIDHPAFIMTGSTAGTVTTENGTSDYALSDSFSRMVEPGVKQNAAPQETLIQIDQQRYDEVEGDRIWSSRDKPRYYMLMGRSTSTGTQTIRLIPTPDAAYTLKYTYFALPTSIKSASDGTQLDYRFPREFVDGLVLAAALHLPQYLTRDQNANMVIQLQDAKRDMRRLSKPYTPAAFQTRRYQLSGGAMTPYRVSGLAGTDLSH